MKTSKLTVAETDAIIALFKEQLATSTAGTITAKIDSNATSAAMFIAIPITGEVLTTDTAYGKSHKVIMQLIKAEFAPGLSQDNQSFYANKMGTPVSVNVPEPTKLDVNKEYSVAASLTSWVGDKIVDLNTTGSKTRSSFKLGVVLN